MSTVAWYAHGTWQAADITLKITFNTLTRNGHDIPPVDIQHGEDPVTLAVSRHQFRTTSEPSCY